MATRRPRETDVDAADTPPAAPPRARPVRSTRAVKAVPAPAPVEEPAPSTATKVVRATRANARAAAAAPATASRTVRIRPDTELPGDDDLEDGYDDAEDYDDEPAPEPASAPPARAARPVGDPDRVPTPRVTTTAPPPGSRPPAKAGPRPPAPPAAAAHPVAPAGVPVAPPPVKAPAAIAVEPAKKGRSGEAILRDVVDKFGTVFQLVAVICAVILVVYVLFVAADANKTNSIFQWFMHRSDNDLVYAFKNVFTPRTHKSMIVENYLLAAGVYLVAGALVKRVCRKIAGG